MKVLITAPVHQDEDIFKEYLWSLNRLIIPSNVEVKKHLYLHNCENLKSFLKEDEYEIIKDDTEILPSNTVHIWNSKNFKIVSYMRTKALEKAREEKYDYVFSVDSDVILNSRTLLELLQNDSEITAKIFWTNNVITSPDEYYPNCYTYRKNGSIKFSSLDNLKRMGVHEQGTVGAATLISSKVFNNEKINYYPITNLNDSKWEDYAFCMKVKTLIPEAKITIDSFHPARHLYRKEDYKNWIEKEKEVWEKEC